MKAVKMMIEIDLRQRGMMMNKLTSLTLTTGILLGFCAGDVLAQHQLDNNLEQSSGHINPQATNVDYGSRNDIIYGNINGGKGFRGGLDYGAPGDFRGNTGSDQLYRFRANAAQSINGQGLTQPQSVQRASHSAVLGNLPSNNQLKNATISSSGIPVDSYRTGQVTNTGQMIQTPEFGASRAGTIGIQGDLSGQSLGVGATSSQGLGVPADTPIGAVNLQPMAVGGNSGSTQTQSDTNLIGALSAPQGTSQTVGHGIAGTSDSLWKIDPDQNMAYPNSTAPSPEDVILPRESAPRTLLAPQQANAPGVSLEEKAARLEAQQMKLEASMMTTVGEDAFMKLQQNQQNRQRVSQGLKPIQHGVDLDNQLVADPSQIKQLPSHQTLFNSITGQAIDPVTGQPSDGSSIEPMPGYNNQSLINDGVPNIPGTQSAEPSSLLNPNIVNPSSETMQAQQLTAEQQAAARQQLQDAMLQSRGVTDSNTMVQEVTGMHMPSTQPEPAVQTQPTGGLFDSQSNVGSSNSNIDLQIQPKPAADKSILGNMGSSAGMRAMSQQRQWHSSNAMSQATDALKAGRYFDAERLYKSVLLSDPKSHEASIGMLCAQLGSGMVRVTAMNLREHMTKFPQHMAYKMDKKLLPSRNRLEWVREQAENLMKQYGNYDAALLIAFMGYQTSDKQLLQYGLGLAQKHLPGDKLVAELSRAWLGQ